MRISTSLVALAWIAAVNAATHTVAVGENGLKYTPNTTVAEVGDIVVFSFYPMDHNVVQGPYSTPCMTDNQGIYSGFIPSSSGMANRTFEITVNNTSPIWFYCSQKGGGGHCSKGMVGVINAPSGTNQTLDAYAMGASKVQNTSYTEPEAPQNGVVVVAVTSNATATRSGSSASITATATGTSATGTTAVSTNAAPDTRTGAAKWGLGVAGILALVIL